MIRPAAVALACTGSRVSRVRAFSATFSIPSPRGVSPGIWINYFASGRSELTQPFDVQSLEHMDIVFPFPNANGQMPQNVMKEIQGIKMTDCAFGVVQWQVVSGGSVPVPVAAIQIQIGQVVQSSLQA